MQNKGIGKVARLVLAVAIGASALVVGAARADAYSSSDCTEGRGSLVDTDYIRADTGPNDNVDVGDQHFNHAPQGNGIVCWKYDSDTNYFWIYYDMRLYWDPEDTHHAGFAWLAISFSSDGQNWGEKVWANVDGSDGWYHDIETRGVGSTYNDANLKDHIRLQLYRSSTKSGSKTRVLTINRKKGDG